MTSEYRNHGIDWERELTEQSPEDWRFGATSAPCIAEIPEGERERYLPEGEIQATSKDDMMDCASRAPVNILEAKLTYLYQTGKMMLENRKLLEEHGYIENGRVVLSDAFVAINSGTTRQGNSLKAPLEALRKHGTVPKKALPLLPHMSFEDYHDIGRITLGMRRMAEEFKDRFIMNYERVEAANFADVLASKDFVDSALFAWPKPKNGEYPHTNAQPNHAAVLFKTPKWYCFDNYLDDGKKGDFIKKLASDYAFAPHGYRFYISAEGKPKQTNLIASLLGLVVEKLKQVVALLTTGSPIAPDEQEPLPAPAPAPEKPDYIQLWAEAIRDFEGYEPHNIAYRNKNPGNIKGRDGKFLVFATHEEGFAYLKDYLTRACTGKHTAYKPDMSLAQAMRVYAPDPEPIPTNYTNACARRIGVMPSTKLKELV